MTRWATYGHVRRATACCLIGALPTTRGRKVRRRSTGYKLRNRDWKLFSEVRLESIDSSAYRSFFYGHFSRARHRC